MLYPCLKCHTHANQPFPIIRTKLAILCWFFILRIWHVAQSTIPLTNLTNYPMQSCIEAILWYSVYIRYTFSPQYYPNDGNGHNNAPINAYIRPCHHPKSKIHSNVTHRGPNLYTNDEFAAKKPRNRLILRPTYPIPNSKWHFFAFPKNFKSP